MLFKSSDHRNIVNVKGLVEIEPLILTIPLLSDAGEPVHQRQLGTGEAALRTGTVQQPVDHEHRELSAECDPTGGGGGRTVPGHSVSEAALAVPSNVRGRVQLMCKSLLWLLFSFNGRERERSASAGVQVAKPKRTRLSALMEYSINII